MLAVSNAFNEAFKQDYRDIKMRIKINDVTYTDSDIISFNYNAGSIVGESFAIGSTFANTIKLTLCKIVEGLKQLDEVIPEMGIVLPDGSIEWVKLGTFIISEQVNPDRNENRTSIECTDKMIMLDDPFESKLPYPAKIKDVALEIANLSGVAVDKTSFSRITESKIQKPIGYTYRQALGLIAQFEAGYAKFDRNGLLAIERLVDKNYEVTPNEYFQKGLVKNELLFRPSGIQVRVSDDSEKIMSVGNSKGSVINLENKVMTKNLLDDMYIKVKDINYYPYSLNWRGNPAVEVGDWLRVTDLKGNQFKVPNLSYSLEYKGGLTATSTVETVASNEVRFGYKKILDQVIEHVDNVLEGASGNDIYYGTEQPPYPKEGDVWFKKVGPDTEIWVYEKIGEPDIFDWVKKISTAMDETLKEKITDLEKISKENTEKADQALLEAEKDREDAKVLREQVFNNEIILKQTEKDALNALAKGDSNTTKITSLEGQQKLTNTKVEGNTANILNLQTDSEKLSLSIGKVQADVDGMEIGDRNLILKSKVIENSYLNSVDYQPQHGQNSMRTGKIAVKQGLEYLFQNYTIRSDFRIFYYNLNGEIKKATLHNVSTVIKIDTSTFWVEVNFDVPGGKYTDNAKITEGNKSGGWSPAPEDLISKTEFATFEATMKGFQTTVNSDITGLQSQQTQMAGQITQTVETLNNIGSDNLLLNTSNFENLSNWQYKSSTNGDGKITLTKHAFYENGQRNTIELQNRGSGENYLISDRVILKRNSYYTIQFKGFASSNVRNCDVFMLTRPKGSSKDYESVIAIKSLFKMSPSQIDTYTYTFKTGAEADEGYIRFDNNGSTNTSQSSAFFTEITVVEGKAVTGYAPSSKENASKSEINQLSDQITQTVNKVETVDGKVTSQQSQITQLSNNINLKVDKDNAIAQINLSPESIRLDAKLIHLSGQSLIDDAVITKAMIKDVSADSMTVGTLNGANVNIINLNADNLTSGFINANRIRARTIRADHLQADAIELALNEMGRSVKLSPVDLKVMNGHLEFMKMDLEGLQVARLDGNRLGTIGRGHKPGYPEIEGLTFSLEHRGQFMSWTSRENINDNYYTDRMILDPKGGYTGVSGLHLETRLRAKQGGTITGGDWQWHVDMNLNKHTIAQPRLANGFIAEDFYFEKGNSLQSYRNIHMNGYNVTGSSSYSLKENFEYMSELDSLNAILVTDIVGYNYIENPDTFNIGFVINDNGQSPYYTDPRLIRSKKYKDDSLLVGHLMLAIKALNEKITLLEERVYER